MRYDIILFIEDVCDLELGEVDISKDDVQNIEDACHCDYVYEIFDMFKGVWI
ncbi:hypothetical protein LCGC14_1797550 [marine sediment metagenome]|uniref:Uncharacterized protein n=1 Tax=marine sediment metagenome TaxID=412755 RepID=A0A0F9HDB1_9ZZZZ